MRLYSLICKTCRIELVLGKIYWFDEQGNEIPYGVGGFYLERDKQYHQRDAIHCEVLEKFLILHRNHDITFVPEYAVGVLAESLGKMEIQRPDQILAAEVVPRPDPVIESASWVRSLGLEKDHTSVLEQASKIQKLPYENQ